ncbi:glycoside hydrolase family 36 N-terminal domain-containing protein, partial [Actinosynnema sp.]|uniref:glycoside hydrolase family 36 N-terminal domain-containing protein n=1 Tax=Actinosynnema sp. TaxID=1872144 RepID=UPI003F851C22
MADLRHLRAAGVSLVLDLTGGTLPRVLHWGADLGPDPDLESLRLLSLRQPIGNSVDGHVEVSVLPEQSAGWLGTPGLVGHREGADFSVAFRVTAVDASGDGVVVRAADETAGLGAEVVVELLPSGVVRQRARVTNTGGSVFTVDALNLALPVPAEAVELLDFSG